MGLNPPSSLCSPGDGFPSRTQPILADETFQSWRMMVVKFNMTIAEVKISVVKFNMTIAEVNISPTSAIERFHLDFDAQKALGSFSIHPSLFHLKAKP